MSEPLRPTGDIRGRRGSAPLEQPTYIRGIFELAPSGAFPSSPRRLDLENGYRIIQHLGPGATDPLLVRVRRNGHAEFPERWLTAAEVVLVAAGWYGDGAQAVALLDAASPNWRQALAAEWRERPVRLVASAQVARTRDLSVSKLELYSVATDVLLSHIPALCAESAVDYLFETLHHNMLPGPQLCRRAIEAGLRMDSIVDSGTGPAGTAPVVGVLDAYAKDGSRQASEAWASALLRPDLRPAGRRTQSVPRL